MGESQMKNGVPMSVIYAGMTVDRFYKLQRLYDEATDTVAHKSVIRNGCESRYLSIDAWCAAVQEEFDKLCSRAAKKAEWNNKPKNKINKIIRKKKVSK